MSNIIIRKLQMPDLKNFSALCDIDDWYYQQVSMTPRALLNYSAYGKNCYVAYEELKLVGYIYGGVLCDTLYPQFMFVRELYRKQGIGKRLMSALESNSGCSVSLIYYNKELSQYYHNQHYEIGTNLEIGMKQIGGEQQ